MDEPLLVFFLSLWGFDIVWIINSQYSNNTELSQRRRHLACHYHLCFYIRWTFQPSHHHCLGTLARLPLEEGSLLHFQPDLRGLHSWYASYGVSPGQPPWLHYQLQGSLLTRLPGHVLASDSGDERGFHCSRQATGCEWRTGFDSVLFPQPGPSESWLCGHGRVLRRLVHRYCDLGLSGSGKRECYGSDR